MRKVTRYIVQAWLTHRQLSMGNTHTDGDSVYLHGNKIAWRTNEGNMIDSCGWKTSTTKERLNGFPGVSVSQKAGVWYLNGKEWDGGPVLVHTFRP
jgi:hypothetical protein